jgi:hypothetical protein
MRLAKRISSMGTPPIRKSGYACSVSKMPLFKKHGGEQNNPFYGIDNHDSQEVTFFVEE